MNRRLTSHENLGGPYSIADMACVDWVKGWKRMGQDVEDSPSARWLDLLPARPAVEKGLAVEFPVGERPTSPRTKRRAKFCSARGAVASWLRAGLAMGAGVGHIPGAGVPTRSGDVAERLKAAVC